VTLTQTVAAKRRYDSLFAKVMLALTLAPIVVSVCRAIVSGWVPTSDAGFFTVRSRDVLTTHHPWIGAWSWASVPVGSTIRSLGPLQLDLLAPFTKVSPYSGTALGVAAVAMGSVIAVWWSARQVIGLVGAGAALLATLSLEAAIGSQAFIDPRQQVYLLLPYWALLWLTWAAATGHGRAIPPLVLLGSVITQTHLTYVIQGGGLVILGLGCYVATVRHRWREAHATGFLLAALVIGLVCWAQPLWDQFAGEGNLGAVMTNRSSATGVGWSRAVEVVASSALTLPRFWLPPTLDEFEAPVDLVGLRNSVCALVVWLIALAGSVVMALRRKDRQLAYFAGVAIAALVMAVLAASQIPASDLGLIPQNYYWMWPTGVFATAALVYSLATRINVLGRVLASLPGRTALVATCSVMIIAAVRPVDHFAPVGSAVTAGERVARQVMDQLELWLRLNQLDTPVVIDYSRASADSYVRYAFLAELQRAGVEFVFDPNDANLYRFGLGRCADASDLSRIFLVDIGGYAEPAQGEAVLAHVDAFTDDDEAALDALDQQFGDWLRDGTVLVDLPMLEFLDGRQNLALRRVMSSPDQPASGLAATVRRWTAWGVVDLDGKQHDELDRWVDLQVRSRMEDVTILLVPNSTGRATSQPSTDSCPS
jgi:hypothetical protein